MTTCPSCGAACREKKDEKRFMRRHPKKCVKHERFNRELAAETKCVDYDEEQERITAQLGRKVVE